MRCGACAGASARFVWLRVEVDACAAHTTVSGTAMSKLQQSATHARAHPKLTPMMPQHRDVLCAVAVAARAIFPALRLLRVLSAFNCSTRRAHHVQRVSVSLWLLFAARANGQFFVNFLQVLLQVLLDRKTCRRFCWSSSCRFCFLSRMFLTY